MRAVSLFAGAGGMCQGSRDAGYWTEAAFDFDIDSVSTQRLNGHECHHADVAEVDFSKYEGADLVIGGPPCQPFSAAGRNHGNNDPRDGVPHFVRAVRQIRPEMFVMENVRGIGFKRHRDYLNYVLESFPSEYRMWCGVINAADYGIPQTRQRFFIIGSNRIQPRKPMESHSTTKGDLHLKVGLPAWKTAASAFGPEWRPTVAANAPGDPSWVYERPATTIVASFRPDILAAPGWRKAGDGPRQNAAGSILITHEEAARLQGLPEWWQYCGSKTSVFRQIGNACPPFLAEAAIRANRTR